MAKLKLWMAKFATLMNLGSPVVTDGRRHLRVQTDLTVLVSGPLGTTRFRCIDLSRGGATISSTEPIEVGTLVFLRITRLGLMGFAYVRHCDGERGAYRLGVEFRDGLTRERTAEPEWECQQVTPQIAWDGPEG